MQNLHMFYNTQFSFTKKNLILLPFWVEVLWISDFSEQREMGAMHVVEQELK